MIDWTYVRPTDSPPRINTPATNPLSSPTTFVFYPRLISDEGVVNTVKASMKNQYQRVNLRLGWYLQRCCVLDYYVYSGIRWIQIKQSRDMHSVNSVGIIFDFREQAEFNGAGLEMGIGGAYNMGCNFALVGHVGGIAAVGNQKLEAGTVTTLSSALFPSTKLDGGSFTHCVPGLDLQLGISYTYECSCLAVRGEIGYEINHYFNPLRVVEVTPTFGINFEDIDVGFAGPYASLSVCF